MRTLLNGLLASAALAAVCAGGAAAAPVTAGTVDIGAQNVGSIPSEGGTTGVVSVGSYAVESFASGSFVRPIFMFNTAAFAGLDPNALVSASLSFILTGSFLESGDTYTTQVRLFSTPSLIPLSDNASASQYAALTGDGGPNTTITTVSFGGTPGVRAVTFSLSALTALSAILSSGGYIGLTIREAAYVDNGASSTGAGSPVPGLDGLLINPNSVTLTIDGAAAPVAQVPVPAALPLFVAGIAGFGALTRRRKRA